MPDAWAKHRKWTTNVALVYDLPYCVTILLVALHSAALCTQTIFICIFKIKVAATLVTKLVASYIVKLPTSVRICHWHLELQRHFHYDVALS